MSIVSSDRDAYLLMFFVKVFGKIVQVDVKASKGFAFVEFDNLDSVKTVLTFGKPIKIGKCVLLTY